MATEGNSIHVEIQGFNVRQDGWIVLASFDGIATLSEVIGDWKEDVREQTLRSQEYNRLRLILVLDDSDRE